MGLDVSLYDENDKRIRIYEIKESLHNEVFNSKKLWRSYLELRKLSDYYRSDEEYEGQTLIELINDLKRYKMFIGENKQIEYQEFIKEISHPSVRKLIIVGD